MTSETAPARASPEVKISDEHRKLLYKVYENAGERLVVLGATEEHLEMLLRQKRVSCAAAFLRDEEEALRSALADLPKKNRRTVLRLVVPSTLAALAAVVAKVVALKTGF